MHSVHEIESALRQHVIDPWFPRSLDREHGGFLCDFDRAWRPCGPQQKLLEFQARHTLFAADASRAFPDDERLREAALHGFRFLRDVMWDGEHGGWFHLVDRSGKPLEAFTKHTHGFAYALSACASVYLTTGDPDALRHAQEALAWMDEHARDREHGGYFGFLKRDGTVIRTPSDAPYKTEMDTVGTEIGFKDLNVHSDLLETFAMLYRVWPDATVRARLAEAVDIIANRMSNPATGAIHFFLTPDWRPVPHLIRVGYQMQSAFRLLLARGLVDADATILRMAVKLVDSAIRYAHDSNVGGFYYASAGAFPSMLHDRAVRIPRKTWWVQVEALKGLLAVAPVTAEPERYQRLAEAQWSYLKRHYFDAAYGGMYTHGLDNVRVWERKLGARLAPAAVTRKGDVWKDASHEGRALLYYAAAARDAAH